MLFADTLHSENVIHSDPIPPHNFLLRQGGLTDVLVESGTVASLLTIGQTIVIKRAFPRSRRTRRPRPLNF